MDDAVCCEASRQEIIRRYYATACAVRRGTAGAAELHKQEMLLSSLGLDVTMRKTVPAARAVAEKTGAPACAIELPDGRIVTGKTSGLMGRTAATAAKLLRGKHKPDFTPNVDCGDFVIILNVDKAVLTGRKLDEKYYRHHTGWIGNLKEVKYRTLMNERPEFAMGSPV